MSADIISLVVIREARNARARQDKEDRKPAKPYLMVEAVIDQTATLEPGDLIAYAWDWPQDRRLYFRIWHGPTGHDERGRFVRRGSKREMFKLDCGLRYSEADLRRGFLTIVGKVVGHTGRVSRETYMLPLGVGDDTL